MLTTQVNDFAEGERPLPRSGHKIVADDKYLYVLGGYVQINETDTNEVRGEVWRLHIMSNTWSKVDIPDSKFECPASHAAIKYGDCIFVTGGTAVPFGVTILNQLLVINLRRNVQSLHKFRPKNGLARNMPIATYGHCIVGVSKGAKILMFGGTTGTNYFTEIYCIDLVSLESELLYGGELFHQPTIGRLRADGSIDDNLAPTGRYKHTVFNLGDDLFYLIGGVEGAECCSLDEVFEFSLSKRRYKRRATKCDIPYPLKYPSMCQSGQFIYLSGGLCPISNEINRYIWQLDLSTMNWTRLNYIWDKPAYFHDSIFLPNQGEIMMIGGVIQTIPVQRRTMNIFKLSPPKTQLRISLQEMCWKRIIAQTGFQKMQTKEEIKYAIDNLSKLGIPWTFLSRVCMEYDKTSFAA